jgi:hypothetical protein
LSKFIPLRLAKEGAGRGQTEGNTEGQTGVPDRGHTGATRGCPTGARWGPDGVPDGGHTGATRDQTGWWTEGLFTFKRKTDMFCIRVM